MRTKEGRSLWGWIFRPGKKVPGEARPKRAPGVQTLWGQEFNLAKKGLEEAQVVAYVEELNSRHSVEAEKLQQLGSPAELASKVIFEAENLAEIIKLVERKRAADEVGEIIFKAEERSMQITDDAERAAILRLQEATELSIGVVGEARELTTLAEEETRQLLPQQMADIQASFQAAIDQAYRKILADMVDLEREIQSRGAEEQPQPPEATEADTTPVESHVETMEEESQPAGTILADTTLVESLLLEEIEDESEVSDSMPTPVEHRIMAEEEKSREAKVFEDGEAFPGLPESARHEPSNPLDGAKEKEQEEGYASLSRDDVREKILESLQQFIELNDQGDTFAANGEAAMDEEQMSPKPKPEAVATNVNGVNVDVPKTNSDLYEGDLEFVMPPQRNGQESPNHLAQLSALYMTVKNIPGASVLGTGGSEMEGNSIAVHFESPVSLAEVLKDVRTWEEERQDNEATKSRSLLGKLKSGKGLDDPQRKRILVTL